MIWALTTLQQWLLFAGTLLVVGCVAWRVLIAPGAVRTLSADARGALPQVERAVVRAGLTAAWVLVLAWALRFVVQLMAFRDPFVPISEDVSFLLFQLSWGTVWMVQGAVVVSLVFALFLARGATVRVGPQGGGLVGLTGSGPWGMVAVLSLALVGTLAASSHAMGVEGSRANALGMDGMHTLAAGVWLGSLTVILATSGRSGAEASGAGLPDTELADAEGSGAEIFAALVRRFSPLALVGGAMLVAMGVGLSWTHLTAIPDLWTTGYGRLVSLKGLLALAILGLGALNWRRVQRIGSEPAAAALVVRRARMEVLIAVAVLLATAVLTHSTKP